MGLLFFFHNSSSKTAEARAQRNAAQRLEREAELVPCPKCHWVNQDLIDLYRRRQYRRAPLLIGVLLVGGVVLLPVVAGIIILIFGRDAHLLTPAMEAGMAFCFLSPLWVLVLRRLLRLRINPNRGYPRRPILPPGTPPALLEQCDCSSGQRDRAVAPTAYDEPSPEDQGLFRKGQISFPACCCMCLVPASKAWNSLLQIHTDDDIAIAVCDSCGKQLRHRWWRIFLVFALVMVIPAAAAALLMSSATLTGDSPAVDITAARWLVFAMLEFVGGVLGGMLVACWACQPYRLSIVDRDRSIMQVTACHPAYAALVSERVRQADMALLQRT